MKNEDNSESAGAALSIRLKHLIKQADIDKNPLLISDSARLLSDVQQWEELGKRLERRVTTLELSASSDSGAQPKSLADWAYEVLLDRGVAMPYREIAAVIRSQGFKHVREPKNPEKQLADSVWTAMYEDDRFAKVGRGIFDLTDRL
jgi:hypothetical protein